MAVLIASEEGKRMIPGFPPLIDWGREVERELKRINDRYRATLKRYGVEIEEREDS